ncbi:MAG: carbohydrate kinase, partial [Clostridia bacterium]|nr:carbohydrate kinase [Clostridia bacterium]
RGAAMLAGRGVGLYADYREAAAAFRTGARYEPDRAAQAIYEPYYQTYRRLSEALLSVARSA